MTTGKSDRLTTKEKTTANIAIAFAKYRAGQWNFSSSNMANVVRAGPLRLSFSLTCNFRSQFKLVGWAGPATNSPFLAYAKR